MSGADLDRILGLMWVVFVKIDVHVGHPYLPQAIPGEHVVDGFAERQGGATTHNIFDGDSFQSARISRMVDEFTVGRSASH